MCQAWCKALGITLTKKRTSRSSQSSGELLIEARPRVVKGLHSEVKLTRYLEMED